MRFPKIAWTPAVLTPVLALMALPAAAQTQLFTFVGAGYPTQAGIVNITTTGSTTSFTSVYAGRYQGQLGSGPTFNILCTDVHHEIAPPSTYTADVSQKITNPIATGNDSNGGYNGGLASAIMNPSDYQIPSGSVTSAEALTRADEVAWLADNYLNAANLTADQSTALSLSVWDIVQDGGNGLNAGSLRTDINGYNTYNSLVATYETNALSAVSHGFTSSNTAYWIQAVGPGTPHAQDYVYEDPTPEPSSVAAFAFTGLGTIGLMLRARKTRRTA